MSPKTWFRLLGLSCLLIVAGFVVPALTQGTNGKKVALLVGVKQYRGEGFSALKYTERDVEELAKVLTKAGFEVRLLTTTAGKKDKADAPTATNIRKEFAALVKAKARGDTVLLALSGHGLQIDVKDLKGEKEPLSYGYFCPSDADTTDIKYSTGYSDHLILITELFEGMGKCQATTKLVLMDACRNETSVKTGSRNVNVEETKVPKGVAALFSCSQRQKAWEHDDLKHGVFFHYVLEGLRGKAKNLRSEVTWSRLAEYVQEQVSESVPKLLGDGAKQEPHAVTSLAGPSPVLVRLDASEEAPKKDKDGGTKVVKGDGDSITNSIGMKLVRVKAGKFTMGSPKGEKDRGTNEDEHEVEIKKDFYLGVTEVTQKQYKAIVGTNPSWFSADGVGKDKVKGMDADDFPVENVSWDDAKAFLDKSLSG